MNRNRKRRVTYRPSKASSTMGGVMGVIFVFIGLVVVIPTFGAFGILWTLFAGVIAGVNFYQGFGKGYVGPEINIENLDEDGLGDIPAPVGGGVSSQDRLIELRTLYDQRLITQEEYEEKRKAILKEL